MKGLRLITGTKEPAVPPLFSLSISILLLWSVGEEGGPEGIWSCV